MKGINKTIKKIEPTKQSDTLKKVATDDSKHLLAEEIEENTLTETGDVQKKGVRFSDALWKEARHACDNSSAGDSSATEYPSDDDSYDTISSSEDETAAQATRLQTTITDANRNTSEMVVPASFYFTCPICLMLPQEHPSFMEMHNSVTLYLAHRLQSSHVCLVTPHADSHQGFQSQIFHVSRQCSDSCECSTLKTSFESDKKEPAQVSTCCKSVQTDNDTADNK